MAKVLLVDDEASIRETFREFLEMDGHEVREAEDVFMAREQIETGLFDVVVSDIVMPKANGVDLLNAIRDFDQDVQVILVTGEPTVETASAALRQGAFDYLAKPVNGQMIRKTVANAARVKSLRDEKIKLEKENKKYQDHLENIVNERTAELRDTVSRLNMAFESVIRAMAATVEKRDPYTAGHQMRVARLARAIAEEMGVGADLIEAIFFAGIIHDLGKIYVPAEILAKPDKLAPEEIAIIRKHSQVGFDILRTIDFPWPVAEIVYQHHERIDGSGYPRGLGADEMLLEAKILSVADVIEAMASHRPYRPAKGITLALEEVTGKQGLLYDSEVVKACLRLFHEKNYSLDI